MSSVQLENVRSDLAIPNKDVLLHRPKILEEINKKLSGSDEIEFVALVGIGGAGKTTIARQYARGKNYQLIWEINAETQNTLLSSVEKLAYYLAKTQEEKDEVRKIQSLKNAREREDQIYIFIKKRIKAYGTWLAIFDNVESFENVKKYFIYDANIWVNGKIIITTRNDNIGNNDYVTSNKVIRVGELTQKEKSKLFNNIVNSNKLQDISTDDIENQKKFLDKIASFPLDISTAAYYLKETKISYEKYSDYLLDLSSEFISSQKNITKDTCEYTKTRSEIISLAIERIIKTNSEFKGLLLLISMIDSQNIPKELLVSFKDELLVEQFLHELRKYSMIIEEGQNIDADYVISLHRSVQNIIFNFISRTQTVEEDLIKHIYVFMSKYIRNANAVKQYNFRKIRELIIHSNSFLNCSLISTKISEKYYFDSGFLQALGNLLLKTGEFKHSREIYERTLKIGKQFYTDKEIKLAHIRAKLGVIAGYLCNHKQAVYYYKSVLNSYYNHFGRNHHETGWVLVHLSNSYRESGEYLLAKEACEKALKIFTIHYGDNHVEVAWALGNLGNVYRHLGNYTKAIHYIEKSIDIFKNKYGDNHPRIAQMLIYSGRVNECLGLYHKSDKLYKKAYEIHGSFYDKSHLKLAWSLVHIGNMHSNKGDNKKALEIITKAQEIHRKNLDEDNIRLAWAQVHIGNIYLNIREYDKALECFRKSIKHYKNYFGEKHIKTANVIKLMSLIHITKNEFTAANILLFKALEITKAKDHPDTYEVLECLSDLNYKRYIYAAVTEQKTQYRENAIQYLKQSLAIVEEYFPENSLHKVRLEKKLQKILSN